MRFPKLDLLIRDPAAHFSGGSIDHFTLSGQFNLELLSQLRSAGACRLRFAHRPAVCRR